MSDHQVPPPRSPRDLPLAARAKGQLRSALAPVWMSAGFPRRVLSQSSGRGVVLMYHALLSLEDRMKGPAAETAAVAAFRRHMRYIREQLRPMSLSELVATLSAGRQIPSNAVVVTFDDGYEDNYRCAFPILREFGIPATIFVTTGAMERPSTFWWDTVAGLVESTAHAALDLAELSRRARLPWDLRGTLPLKTAGQKQQAADYVSALFRIAKCGSNPEAVAALRELLCVRQEPPGPPMLRWAQIQEMAGAGIEFGAHTVSHPDLTQLSLADARRELVDSKEEIEGRLKTSVETFAFPYGTARHWGPALDSLARDVKFKGVVCAESGSVGEASNPYWLPRLSPSRSLGEAVWSICKALHRPPPPAGAARVEVGASS